MTPADRPPPSTSAEIIEYLLDERLITTRDIVDGDVRAVPVGGRNRNVRVVSANGRSYFVKQAEPGDATAAETVAREAAFYERVRDDDAWTGLRDVVPRCLAFDSRRALLTLELIADACNAHELDDIDGPTAFPRIGALLGAALAACHAAPSRATNATARDAAVEHDLGPPWILDLARPTPS